MGQVSRRDVSAGTHKAPSTKKKRSHRAFWVGAVVVLLVVSALAVSLHLDALETRGNPSDPASTDQSVPSDTSFPRTYRAFWPNSWWNTPVPWDAPQDPNADQILTYLRTASQSGDGCLTLAGAGSSPWGNPIYWARPSDPAYDVSGVTGERPPEISDVRIPVSAEPAANNDGTMTIYDMQRGYVTLLSNASYDSSSDQWSASGATVTYLQSNGLNVDTGKSDDPRNVGTHRGNNGATNTVSWDMVQAGAIRHVLKIALGPEVSNRAVFPMTGSDGKYEGNDPGVPPQGLRLRIAPSVDLTSLDLNPQALVIARAIQRFGVYIGDSGGTTALKLENTRAEGRGQLWKVTANSLCSLPFTPAYWQVLAEGYDPSK